MKHACDNKRCFANVDGGCTVLNNPKYKRGKCPFFKTPQQIKEQQERCKARLKRKLGIKCSFDAFDYLH